MRQPRLTAVALLLLAACGAEEQAYEPPRPLTAQEQELVTASNQFGFDLFGRVVTDSAGENVFVSPLSVSMALGMAYNGARGATAEGMAGALAYADMDLDQVNASYQSLVALLVGMDPEVTLEVANSVWYRQGLVVLDAFLEACRTYFAAAVEALDFDSPTAVDRINAWVAAATHGKIDGVVEEIDPLTMMFLVNAVYFDAAWSTRFDTKRTETATFHGAAGDSPVQMMHAGEQQTIAYTSAEAFQAARLPYGHGSFAMTILLPKAGDDVDSVAAGLDPASWAAMQAAMTELEIPLGLPRFELEYEATLDDALAALGMPEAFDPSAADFSGITAAAELYITEVKHKTYVRVNEEGTEAAAVTSVEMGVRGMADSMIVDRPFLLVIHDTHSQALLFMGRILDL